MLLATEEEVCILSNMSCKIKSIVFKIKTPRFYWSLWEKKQVTGAKLINSKEFNLAGLKLLLVSNYNTIWNSILP